MPLDAALSESATHSDQLVGAETGDRRTPMTIMASAADVGLGTREGTGNGHRSTSDRSSIRRRLRCTEFLKVSVNADSLVLDVHRIGIHGLLPRDAFESSQHTPTVVLVALHGR